MEEFLKHRINNWYLENGIKGAFVRCIECRNAVIVYFNENGKKLKCIVNNHKSDVDVYYKWLNRECEVLTVTDEELQIRKKEVSSRVMKRAWVIKKQDALNIWSICLKMAWAEEHEGLLEEKRIIIIDHWAWDLVEQKFGGGYLVDFSGIVKETEKAALIKIRWGFHSTLIQRVEVWIPKKAIHFFHNELEEQTYINFVNDKKFEKYNKMLDFAREKGIKGIRSGLKKDTILRKIKAAGYDYVY